MVSTNQKAGMALARGFIVLIMPSVHSVWLYSSGEVKEGWLGQTLGFLAEGPGAQLFMFLMGVLIVISRPKTFRQIFRRSLLMFIAAYILNFFKLVVPYYAGWIPGAFLRDNGFKVGALMEFKLLMVGDILQFAAIAYLFCSLLMKAKCNRMLIITSIIIVLIISPWMWLLSDDQIPKPALLELFIGAPPQAFFPVFPWLFYPLLGVAGGIMIQKKTESSVSILFFVTGVIMIILGKAIIETEPIQWQETFYRLGRGGTIVHGGVVLLWLVLFLGLSKLYRQNYLFRFLQWLSNNITIIYLLQWVVVMWMLPVFGYSSLGLGKSIAALLVTSAISFVVPFLMKRYFFKHKMISHEK